MDHRSLILFASVIAFAVAGTSARAEDGVTKDRIVFGQVAALEGPARPWAKVCARGFSLLSRKSIVPAELPAASSS